MCPLPNPESGMRQPEIERAYVFRCHPPPRGPVELQGRCRDSATGDVYRVDMVFPQSEECLGLPVIGAKLSVPLFAATRE